LLCGHGARPDNDPMIKRTLVSMLTLAAVAASPAAADSVIVAGAEAQRMTALDRTVVWTSGRFPSQTLMQRTPDGSVSPVKGAPVAVYRSLDLGHDGSGDLVLTYIRCAGTRNCKAISDDLDGRRTSFKRLAPPRCELTSAPARWRERVAYGLSCDKVSDKSQIHDRARSGLFVRKGLGPARRLRLPKDAVRFGVDQVSWVDLRGTIVGAAATDIYSYAFAQTVNGANLRSTFAAASEGESDEHVAGLSLGAGGLLWTLVDAVHTGDPTEARISRLTSGTCADTERLVSAPGEFERYRAEAMAVDGSTVYLSVPGAGISVHSFTPTFNCR
jgi:hypothetical protein